MNDISVNPNAWSELRERIHEEKLLNLLEKKLKENGDELADWIQINGDNLHFDILAKGPPYWYAIYAKNKQGQISKMTRICDYLNKN